MVEDESTDESLSLELRTRQGNGHASFTAELEEALEAADRSLPFLQEYHQGVYGDLIRLSRLVNQANVVDPLTGAYNIRKLEEDIKEAVSDFMRGNSPGISIFALDLDHFKKVNDQFGHPKGDQVLQDFVYQISEGLRIGDGVYRVGGEEFIVLAKHTRTADEGYMVAEKLRKRVLGCSFKKDDDKLYPITTSIGVTHYDGHYDHIMRECGLIDDSIDTPYLRGIDFTKDDLDKEELKDHLKRMMNVIPLALRALADAALYRAKETGRNKVVVYNPSMKVQHSNSR